MADENLKIFNSRGEYKMSEDDTFKFAKSVALESAEKILDTDVKNFLHDKFKNLDDDDIDKISEKFLTKNEPHFIRENLSNGDMICYAEIQSEISLTDLDNFMKNFDVFKLEKKVDEQKKIIDEFQYKLELFQKFLPDLIRKEIDVKNNPNDVWEYYSRGNTYLHLKNYSQAIEDYTKIIKLNPNYVLAYNNCGDAYYNLKNYSQSIEDDTQVIKLDPNFAGAYYNRGEAHYYSENYLQAIEDYTQAIKLDPNDAASYYSRGLAYKEIGENEKAEKDFAKARELYQKKILQKLVNFLEDKNKKN